MPEGFEYQRRLPSVDRKIKEIKPEDIRVRLTGTIVDKQGERMVLDDGTGKITVNFENTINANISQFVRVMGRLIPIQDGFELQGELIQDFSKIDIELLKKVENLEKEAS